MNVAQHKLKRIIDLLPQRPAVLTFIHKHGMCFLFKHPTLNIGIAFYKGSVKRAEDVIYSVADSYQALLEKVMKSNSIFTMI